MQELLAPTSPVEATLPTPAKPLGLAEESLSKLGEVVGATSESMEAASAAAGVLESGAIAAGDATGINLVTGAAEAAVGATAMSAAETSTAAALAELTVAAKLAATALAEIAAGGGGGGGPLDLLGGLFKGGGSTPVPGFGLPPLTGPHAAHGGLLSGPGTGTSDSIQAQLSDGEFVVTAAATRANLPTLRAMNAGRLAAFADGGLVRAAAPAGGAPGGDGGDTFVVNVYGVTDVPGVEASFGQMRGALIETVEIAKRRNA